MPPQPLASPGEIANRVDGDVEPLGGRDRRKLGQAKAVETEGIRKPSYLIALY
jgi:hypothetical protein